MSVDYLLHESAAGYAIFEVVHQSDVVGNRMKEVQDAVQDLAKFGKMVKLVSFAPFAGAAMALDNANEISEGIASQFLLDLLEVNLPKSGKKQKVSLGVSERYVKAQFCPSPCFFRDNGAHACLDGRYFYSPSSAIFHHGFDTNVLKLFHRAIT